MVQRSGITPAPRWRTVVAAWAAALLIVRAAHAQGPQLPTGGTSAGGAAAGVSAVGQPLGAANFPDFSGARSIAPVSGRAGPGGSRAPLSGLSIPGAPVFRTTGKALFSVQPIAPLEVPAYGELELPAGELSYGSADGMTLDTAIEMLIRQNLDLEAMRLEIPMAQADVLTANLRANPIFYADQQLVPYGHYSFLRPGGPQQSDINLNYPLDITFKRRARTRSAIQALKVSEAQLQDAVRNQIDNLYTVYVNVISAGLTVTFSETYERGLRRLLALVEGLYNQRQIPEADVSVVRANLERAEIQVREARAAKLTANQALALILNLSLADLEKLDVRDPIGQFHTLPMPSDELVQKALTTRPDLGAIRLGVARAESDLRLARANAYPDIYLLWQPFTFQNNTYLGVQSAYSWTLGVTATVPLYDRNQGNIRRAMINVNQTKIQMRSQERMVISDVLANVRELEQSLASVRDVKTRIVPDSQIVRDAAYRRFQAGEITAQDYLEAQRNYNDVVKSYRDALIRHRNAALNLNTAVGERVLP
jgi:cobalt-zinc-cadmium efflux system outer membrane protein